MKPVWKCITQGFFRLFTLSEEDRWSSSSDRPVHSQHHPVHGDTGTQGQVTFLPNIVVAFKAWDQTTKDSSQRIQVPECVLHQLTWRASTAVCHDLLLATSETDITLYTDASLYGWGAQLGDHSLSGHWSLAQRSNHINVVEMQAVIYAVQGFQENHCHYSCVSAGMLQHQRQRSIASWPDAPDAVVDRSQSVGSVVSTMGNTVDWSLLDVLEQETSTLHVSSAWSRGCLRRHHVSSAWSRGCLRRHHVDPVEQVENGVHLPTVQNDSSSIGQTRTVSLNHNDPHTRLRHHGCQNLCR